MANCFCLQEGFLSIDGGCNPRTGANAVVDTVGGIVEAGLQPIEAASNLANEAFEAVGVKVGKTPSETAQLMREIIGKL